MMFTLFDKRLILLVLVLAYSSAHSQTKRNFFSYRVDLGISQLKKYPDSLYFQSGVNGYLTLGFYHVYDNLYSFGIELGAGSSRYFIDATIENSRLAPVQANIKQQDFSVGSLQLFLFGERTFQERFILKLNQGITYYYQQTSSSKFQNSSSVVKRRSSLNIWKPLTEVGLLYDFGGKPNLNLGIIIRGNMFSQNFTNARPIDFNIGMRFRFSNSKTEKRR